MKVVYITISFFQISNFHIDIYVLTYMTTCGIKLYLLLWIILTDAE